MSTLAELFQTHGQQFIKHFSWEKMIDLSAGQQQLTKASYDYAFQFPPALFKRLMDRALIAPACNTLEFFALQYGGIGSGDCRWSD